jgi:hypothetical protein
MAITRNAYFDQKVYIGAVGSTPEELHGVQNFNGSWELPLTPIKAAGYGAISVEAEGEMQGSVSVSRLITHGAEYDPLINFNYGGDGGLLNQPVTGFLSYGTNESFDKAFYFNQGRINSYSSSCSVGSIATSDFSVQIYGDIGSGDYAGNDTVLPALIAKPGDITVSVADSTTNALQSYDLNINLDWQPLYGIGSAMKPIGYRLNYPIEVSVGFNMIVDSYESRDFYNLLCAPQINNLELTLNDCGTAISKFKIDNAQLTSNDFSSNIGDNMTVDISYVSYLNTVDELKALFPVV